LGDTKRTVLVVDDDKSILRTLTRILQKSGYIVENAETGKEALEKLGKQTYDVALIDIKLPDFDGTDLLALQKESLSNTVKILITGLTSAGLGIESFREGADACLMKPVKPEELLSIIEEKLKNRKSRKS
jgi:DNA-binding response OmpR family regulator